MEAMQIMQEKNEGINNLVKESVNEVKKVKEDQRIMKE
jgi:hypothetical protein